MKILVVDDEQDVQLLFQQKFRKEIKRNEFEFRFAFSGEDALEAMKEFQDEAILILSDINMPGMSGLELLKEIKTIYVDPPPPPVVMMITAYGDDGNYSEAMKLGADDFLTKPVDFKALKEKLRSLDDGQA
ncbi:MAG: response regulator [Bacteroidota bacterium]